MKKRLETNWFAVQLPLDVQQTKDPGFFSSTYGGIGVPSMSAVQKYLDDVTATCSKDGWTIKAAFPINGFAYAGAAKASESYLPYTTGIVVLAEREVE